MVYVVDEQHDPVTEANPFGPHRGSREKYLWRRRRIFSRREVLLRKAIGIPSELVRQLDLAHHLPVPAIVVTSHRLAFLCERKFHRTCFYIEVSARLALVKCPFPH